MLRMKSIIKITTMRGTKQNHRIYLSYRDIRCSECIHHQNMTVHHLCIIDHHIFRFRLWTHEMTGHHFSSITLLEKLFKAKLLLPKLQFNSSHMTVRKEKVGFSEGIWFWIVRSLQNYSKHTHHGHREVAMSSHICDIQPQPVIQPISPPKHSRSDNHSSANLARRNS